MDNKKRASKPQHGTTVVKIQRSLATGTAFGFVAFLLAYFDELYFGPVKFGILWKAIIVTYIAWLWLTKVRKSISPQFAFGMAYALKSLLYSYESIKYFFTDVSEAIKFIVLPLTTEIFEKMHRGFNAAQSLRNFLLYFVPLSCLPFLFGLEPLVDRYSLDIYGSIGNEFSGVFGTKHGAAVTLAATIVLIFHEIRIKKLKIITGSVLMMICAFSLYLTYVRTGYFSLAVGGTIYLFAVYRIRALIPLLLSFTLAASLLYSLALSNDVLRMRLTGTNMYTEELSVNQFGSGRFEFWNAAIDGPIQDGAIGVLFGRGLEKTKDHMLEQTGLRIFSHNGFFDAYQTNGVVGLLIFLAYWISLSTMIIRRRKSPYGAVAMAIMAEAIVVQLVQGGSFFWLQILLAACIASTQNTRLTKDKYSL